MTYVLVWNFNSYLYVYSANIDYLSKKITESKIKFFTEKI